jgi:hypothetical protein
MEEKNVNLVREFYQKLVEPEREAIKKLLAMDRERRKVHLSLYITQGLFADMGDNVRDAIFELAQMSEKEIVDMLAEQVRKEIERGFWATIGYLLSKVKWW